MIRLAERDPGLALGGGPDAFNYKFPMEGGAF
jgi:hypothetical protein